ncbi:MAG TPA: EamA family transporter [Candidatus Limnocylindrales bacterium]|jgi:drug/metabolite transporter (DMT)-like permease
MSVVVLGILSAISWGLGDFGGGWTSRRVPVAGVLLFSQVGGAALSLVLASWLGEGFPQPSDIGWAIVSSLFGGVGLACLYIGLARGRMGVVAPITGVMVAAIPAIAGIVLQGVPSSSVLVGIALAISSVVVVSRVGDAADGRPSGWRWGLAAGVTLGAVTLTLSRMTPGLVFGPLTVMRLGEAGLIALALVLAPVVAGPRLPGVRDARRARPGWRIPRRFWLAVLAVGACDSLGTACYIAATQAGSLAIAGVLSALYPVTTVVLAIAILREQLARWHVLGVALSGAAIVLITAGA